ncbi:MAG: acyltransferase family protein [Flavobacteriia bacterium]
MTSNIENQKLDFSKRIIGLDIMRSMAILFVVYSHSVFLLTPNSYYKFNLDGVNLFFVLSGFLVGKIIYDEFESSQNKLKSLWKFWVFRWVKTLPSYFIILLILFSWTYFKDQDTSEFKMSFLFFGQNFYDLHNQLFKESWSLSVEEWFYLLFPLLLMLSIYLTKSLKKSFLFWIIFFILFSQVAKYYAEFRFGSDTDFKDTVRKIVIYRFDSIMFGVLMFVLESKFSTFFNKFKIHLLLLGIAFLVLLEINWQLLESYGGRNLRMSLETISAALLLPFFFRIRQLKFHFLNFFFLQISKISYALYLVNLSFVLMIIIPKMNEIFKIDAIGLIPYLCFWILSIFFAYMLYFLIEKPLVSRRKYFVPK